MRGVCSVGGRLSLMVIRNTVMESRAEMPRVTFSPDSDGTKNTSRAENDKQALEKAFKEAYFILIVSRYMQYIFALRKSS